jgi:hypothetical protein
MSGLCQANNFNHEGTKSTKGLKKFFFVAFAPSWFNIMSALCQVGNLNHEEHEGTKKVFLRALRAFVVQYHVGALPKRVI